jgi:hypothetical protein
VSTAVSPHSEFHLKYSMTNVLAAPDINAAAIETLHEGDDFQVTRQVGLFYAVTLADGREGFVFSRNFAGPGLPSGTSPEPAAPAAESPVTLRGRLTDWLRLLSGRGS